MLFNAWLFAPAWEGGRISRYLAGLRQSRTGLLAAFPNVPGADEDAYLVGDKFRGTADVVVMACGGDAALGIRTWKH
jgi:hypothetical protein